MTTRKAMGGTVLVILAAATGIGLSRKPWIVYMEQKKQLESQRAEMRQSEDERAALLREESRVRSSVGQEELARAHGFVNQGEEPADPR